MKSICTIEIKEERENTYSLSISGAFLGIFYNLKDMEEKMCNYMENYFKFL